MRGCALMSELSGNLADIYSSFQNEGPLIGSRQIVVRFRGCPLNCVYCFTPEIKKTGKCRVENTPGMRDWKLLDNPVKTRDVEKHIVKLITPDLHSVNFSGGEPLSQPEFFIELAKAIHKFGGIVYLDTAGFSCQNFKKVLDYCEYVKVDVKSPDAGAVPLEQYDRLLSEELECVKASLEKQKPTIVKVVVMETTSEEWFKQTISQVNVDVNSVTFFNLTITPVTPFADVRVAPSLRKLFKFSELAAKYIPVDFIQVTPQIQGYYRAPPFEEE
jgi:pyruvate-formate lyase-activating enzyme